jgi:hypothetical protein
MAHLDLKQFTTPNLAAIIETIANPEDLEEIHHVLLLTHIRAYLDHLVEVKVVEIVREGKPGRPFIFQKTESSNANAN